MPFSVGHITEFVRVNRRFRLEPVLVSNRAVPSLLTCKRALYLRKNATLWNFYVHPCYLGDFYCLCFFFCFFFSERMQDLREGDSQRRASELERQLRDSQQREENFQRQLREMAQREGNLQRQFREHQEREQNSQRRLT